MKYFSDRMLKISTHIDLSKHIGPKFVQKGERMRDFIFGFSDGILTTLVIVAALSGAALTSPIIIIAGLANLSADGIATSLGSYISSKSQYEIYKRAIAKKKEELDENPEREKKDLVRIFKKKGMKGKELKNFMEKITANKRKWLEIMVAEELGLSKESFDNPLKISGTIFLTFLLAGSIPLTPFFLTSGNEALIASLIISFAAIFSVGGFRSVYTGKGWGKSAVEMLVIGIIATAAAYLVGDFGAKVLIG